MKRLIARKRAGLCFSEAQSITLVNAHAYLILHVLGTTHVCVSPLKLLNDTRTTKRQLATLDAVQCGFLLQKWRIALGYDTILHVGNMICKQ